MLLDKLRSGRSREDFCFFSLGEGEIVNKEEDMMIMYLFRVVRVSVIFYIRVF